MAVKKTIATIIFMVCVVCAVYAFQFSPLEQTFGSSGVDTQRTYTIVNDSDEDIAVRISVLERDMDEFGNEVRSETSSSEFLLTPSQVIVRAQSAYVVRVRYRGPSVVTSEKAYRLVAEQIPYSTGSSQDNASMFNFLYVYVTSLYVSPSREQVSVGVDGVTARVDEEGNQVLDVTIRNGGNVHQILSGAKLVVTDPNGASVTLSGSENLEGVDSMNILAKKTVTKTIAWPTGLAFVEGGTYRGSLSYDK